MRYLIVGLFFLFFQSAFSQSVGDYRSAGTGTWGTLATWQRWNGGAWVTPTAAQGTPTSASGLIEIQTGHIVTVAAALTVDQVTVNGTLTVNADITAGPAASVLTVNGTVNSNSATIGGSTTSNIFNAGSLYVHDSSNGNGGIVPTATWSTTSTLRIALSGNTSYTFTSTSWSQTFGNVEVNITTNGNRTIDLAGLVRTINGNFTIVQIGVNNGTLVLANSGTNNITVGGNFSMNTGATRIFNLASGGTTTLHVQGNFTFLAGTITTTGTGNINFNGTGSPVQNYIRAGTVTGAVNYSIASGAIVDVTTNSFIGTGNFTLSGELRTGNLTGLNGTLTNTGTRTFNANCTVMYNGTGMQVMGTFYPAAPPLNMHVTINNTAGVTTSITPTIVTGVLTLTAGNLNVSTGHTLQLNGSLSRTAGNVAMNFNGSLTINGNGALGTSPFPFSADPIFQNLTINRPGGTVDFANNVTLIGSATFTAGTLTFNSQTFTWNGAVSFGGGFISGNNASVLNVVGSGAIGTIDFAVGGNILSTFSLNRIGANATLGGDLTIASTMDIQVGNLNGGANTITMQGTSWNINGVSGGTFTPGTSLVIFDGNTTVSSTSSFHHIQLNAARSVTFPASTVNVSGDITFDATGTFTHSSGTVQLNGGGNQSFSGGDHQFNNISCNKGGGNVLLTDSVRLISVLDVLSATDFQSNGFLTLISSLDDPDQTASINTLSGGAQVSGNVIVQRYMGGEGRIYRYLSSPVTNATVSGWMDDFAITGGFSDPSTTDPVTGLSTICGLAIRPTSPSLYYYNEAVLGGLNDGWVAYPPAGQLSTATPIVVGRGYAAFIRECGSPTNVDLSGPINQGNISLPVTFNGSTPNPDGWNLVGNPYPSSIIWDAGAGWTKNNINTNISVRDNGGGGIFQVFAETDGASIASGQGFWTLATGASPQLDINEQAKTTVNGAFYRENRNKDVLEIRLSNGQYTDKAYFKVVEGATPGFDRYDFPNQDNDVYDLGIVAAGHELAVNAVGSFACEADLQLSIKDMTNGSYSFAIVPEGIFAGVNAFLHDKYTGTTINLTEQGVYQFSITSQAASKAYNRFRLILNRMPVNEGVKVNTGKGYICTEDHYVIEIENPQPYVSYYVEMGGQAITSPQLVTAPGNVLKLFVPQGALSIGENPIEVKGSNSCSSVKLAQQTISRQPIHAAQANSAVICFNGQAELTAFGAPSDNTYTWYASAESHEPLFQGKVFITPELSSSTAYYVAAVNPTGCEGVRTAVAVAVSNPIQATITVVSKNRLRSNYAFGNQWYFNDVLIPGGKHQHLNVSKSGTYRVDVSVDGCITSASFDFRFIHGNENQSVVVFPNPVSTTNELFVEFLANTPESVKIINSSGATVMDVDVHSAVPGVWSGSVNVSDLQPGTYLVRVAADGKTKTVKFIRIR